MGGRILPICMIYQISARLQIEVGIGKGEGMGICTFNEILLGRTMFQILLQTIRDSLLFKRMLSTLKTTIVGNPVISISHPFVPHSYKTINPWISSHPPT